MRRWMAIVLAMVVSALALAVPVTFTYQPPEGLEVRSVSLRGSFNSWGETPMKQNPDGSWSVTLDLDPGEYAYKFFINGQWPKDMCNDETFGRPMVDPKADGCIDDGFGGQNAVRIVAAPVVRTSGPVELGFKHDAARATFVSEAGGRVSIRFWANEGSVAKASVIVGETAYPMHRQLVFRGTEVWRASVPSGAFSYRFEVEKANGETKRFGPYRYDGNGFRAIPWVAGRAGYQIFPERFWNGDPSNDRAALSSDEYNFNQVWREKDPSFRPQLSPWNGPITPQLCCHEYFGGDLAGIEQKIPYLKAQGVGLVYLNPIFESGSAHGYDTHDYMKVSAKFGDKATLRRLIEKLHAAGIRVIFDFVPNHTGLGFWAFRDVVEKGPNSPYWNWYFIKKWPFKPGDATAYEAWWGVPSLPKLNTGNPAVRRYLIEVAKYWVGFGFDGVRVDVPTELIAAKDFFKALKAELKKVRPDVYLVGEIWDLRPDWVGREGFDSLMNYALGRKVLLTYAKGKPQAFANGKRALLGISEFYAKMPEASAAMGFNLIASHDTSRLLTDLGGGKFGDVPGPEARKREALAFALLFSMPGVPVVWQGDECAFLGEKDPYDKQRYPIQWQACDQAMAGTYRLLANLRRDLKALSSPVIRSYYGKGPLLAFFRGEPGPDEVLVVFNNAEKEAVMPLPPGGWQDVLEVRTFRKEVKMPPLSWRYLRKR